MIFFRTVQHKKLATHYTLRKCLIEIPNDEVTDDSASLSTSCTGDDRSNADDTISPASAQPCALRVLSVY